MDGSIEHNRKTLAALDGEGLGRLVRASALKAVAMHFALRGMCEQFEVNGETPTHRAGGLMEREEVHTLPMNRDIVPPAARKNV